MKKVNACNACPARRSTPVGIWESSEYLGLRALDKLSRFKCHKDRQKGENRRHCGYIRHLGKPGCYDTLQDLIGVNLKAVYYTHSPIFRCAGSGEKAAGPVVELAGPCSVCGVAVPVGGAEDLRVADHLHPILDAMVREGPDWGIYALACVDQLQGVGQLDALERLMLHVQQEPLPQDYAEIYRLICGR